jgi:hypothetical protein
VAHPADVGLKSEVAVLAELVKRDYRVLVPFGTNCRYDFVIAEEDGGFVRVQVKTGRYRNGAVIFNGRSVNGGTRKARRYDKDQIDVYMVYCPELGTMYRVPVEDASGEPKLRIEPSRNGQLKGVTWASDYVF